jgi:hypothetical protein
VATTELKRFAEFFAMLGYRLEDFQREIVREAFSERRELLVLIPRANGKSTLLAAIALWGLLRGRGSQIVVGAASREQAACCSTSRARWPSTPRSHHWSRSRGARSAPPTAG